MQILLVEDDPLQAELVTEFLTSQSAFPSAVIRRISTESQFRSNFEDIASNNPDVIIMDIMLRWADPAPEFELPPEDIAEEGFYRAGLRCERLLANDPRTSDIPIILYTILGNGDLSEELPQRPQTMYLAKDFEPKEIVALISKVCNLV
jgi:CheY-like chemotaxis protein